jgi:CheY-specific phosphatase CheX
VDAKLSDIEIFSGSLLSVLENMAFIFADPSPADMGPEAPEQALLARMTYRGMENGTVCVAAPFGLCREIAVNMLGAGPGELSASEVLDALRELLNMSCGQFLTERFGEELVFDLSIPEVSPLEAGGWNSHLESPGVRLFEAEGYPLLASFSIA